MSGIKIEEIENIKRGVSWSEIKNSMKQQGCPICIMVSQSIEKYFKFLLYEYALDATVQKKIQMSFGLCKNHTKLLKDSEIKLKSDGLNISVLYENVLKKELKILKQAENKIKETNAKLYSIVKKKADLSNYKKVITSEMQSKAGCLGCLNQKENESFYTHEIIRLYADQEFRERFEKYNVILCRRHFIFLVNESESKEAIEYFLKVQQQKISELYTQLTDFIEKHDHRLKSQMSDVERKSWERVLEYFG